MHLNDLAQVAGRLRRQRISYGAGSYAHQVRESKPSLPRHAYVSEECRSGLRCVAGSGTLRRTLLPAAPAITGCTQAPDAGLSVPL